MIRARDGDRAAFAELVDSYSDRCYATAYRILRDTSLAEDAVQDALVTAWRQLPTLREADRFEAWLRRLLVHACYAEAGRRKRWSASIRLVPVGESAEPDRFKSVVDRDSLERAFRDLSVEHRAIFVLHHQVGLPLVEIAETLGIPAGTARSRLHTATRMLRAAMEAAAAPAVPKGWMA